MTQPNAFSAWQLEPLELAAFQAQNPARERPLSVAQARYLLSFSLLAPSAHNTLPQAYGLELEQGRIALFLRREHVLDASDPTGREAVISVGCAVENLLTAAAAYGVTATWQPRADLSWPELGPSKAPDRVRLGHVQLSDPGTPPDEGRRRSALVSMLERKVVRAEFDASPLPRSLAAELAAVTHPDEAVSLHVFETESDRFAWGKLDELAMKHKLEQPNFRVELGRWLLPNDDDWSSRGMRGREFGLDDPVTLSLSEQLRGEAPMASDQTAFMARAGRIGLTSSSAVCVLSCLDQSPEAAVAAGRVYQRCALLAWNEGVVHAVHTAVCKVSHTSAMAQATLLRGAAPPSVIFRLGRPRHPSDLSRAHSSRAALSELLVDARGEVFSRSHRPSDAYSTHSTHSTHSTPELGQERGP